eukprot:165577-Pyramimonas_sp.AAC.1
MSLMSLSNNFWVDLEVHHGKFLRIPHGIPSGPVALWVFSRARARRSSAIRMPTTDVDRTSCSALILISSIIVFVGFRTSSDDTLARTTLWISPSPLLTILRPPPIHHQVFLCDI